MSGVEAPSLVDRVLSFSLAGPTYQHRLSLEPTGLAGRRGLRQGVVADIDFVKLSPLGIGPHGVPLPYEDSTRWTHSIRLGYFRTTEFPGTKLGDGQEVRGSLMSSMALGDNQIPSRWNVGLGPVVKVGSSEAGKTYVAGGVEGRVLFEILRPDSPSEDGFLAAVTVFGAVGADHEFTDNPSLDYEVGAGWHLGYRF